MEYELVLAGVTLLGTLGEAAVAYFGMYRPYRAAKKKGTVKNFSEYWSSGMESFREVISQSWDH